MSSEMDRAGFVDRRFSSPSVEAAMDTLGDLRASLGYLASEYDIPGADIERTATQLDLLGSQFSDVEEEMRALRDRAIFDSLTGLPNREEAEAVFEGKVMSHIVSGGTVLAAFVDVDDFKNINSQLTHSGGDIALTKIAEEFTPMISGIKDAFRGAVDIPFRIGGDEFLVYYFIPPDSIEMIMNLTRKSYEEVVEGIAEMIEERFGCEELELGINGKEVEICMTAGVVSVGPGENFNGLQERASQRMLDNKPAKDE